MDDEPRDPDLDALDRLGITDAPGPWRISGLDPETGETVSDTVTPEQVATMLAQARRLRDRDDAA